MSPTISSASCGRPRRRAARLDIRTLPSKTHVRSGTGMAHGDLANTIDKAFEERDRIGPATKGPVRDAVEAALDLLDRGMARVAERQADGGGGGKPGVQEGRAA